jgi:hypothetical protein
MFAVSGIALQRTGVGAIARAVGGAVARWWVAYTIWRIEQWATGHLTP